MEEQLLIEKPAKIKYIVANIIVKSCTFNENERPVKLISSKDIEYSFPKMISTNTYSLMKLKKILMPQNKIEIIYSIDAVNIKRIHGVDNMQLSWEEFYNYKLMILSWTKGLLFNDYIFVSFYENVLKFYRNYGYDKFFCEGLEITIIIKDTLPVDIPTKY